MTTILVLGNASVDVTLTMHRLPKPGETVVATGATIAPGGKGLNQAVVAARAGTRTRFCAPIGMDADGDLVAAALAAEPFAEVVLHRKATPTDRSIVMVGSDGENSIVTVGGSADALTSAEASAFVGSGDAGDWLLVQGNLSLTATLAAVRAAGGPIVLNAAPLRWELDAVLALCRVIVVNQHEAAAVTGSDDPAAALAWFQARGCRTPIVTLGGDGCLWAEDGDTRHLPADQAVVTDTTGAGDTFCGVLAARMVQKLSLHDAILSAQAASALTVTRAGVFAALPTAIEL